MQLAGRIRQGGILTTFLVVLLGTASIAFAADWPQWRQNVLHTASHEQPIDLPLTRGWTLEGYYFFSPAVANGTVYLPRSTDQNTPTPGGGLVAYRLSTGVQLWARTDLAVWGNAAVSGATVVVGGSALYALDTSNGSMHWSYDEPAASDIIFENPTIDNGVVYAWKRNSGIIALDLATGTRVWPTHPVFGSVSGPAPIVTADAVYAIGNFPASPRGMVWKINRTTGLVQWATPLLFFAGGGALANNTIVVSGPVRTFGVDTATGAVRWFRNLSSAGMPVVRGDTVSVLYDRQMTVTDFRAYVISFDAANGPSPLAVGTELGGRARGVSPVLSGEQYIYSTEDGTIHVRQGLSDVGTFEGLNPWAPELAAADGKLLAWSFLGQRLYTFGTSDGGPPVEEKEPVIYVPGIVSCWNALVLPIPPNPDFQPIEGWRAFLRSHYATLFDALNSVGVLEGQDLFIGCYDWRLPADKASGYLEKIIDHAKRVSGKDKVDIVAHSYGGLVSRAYIQSDRYRSDVDQLITLGTPHKGAAKAYPIWEGGEWPPGDFWIQMMDIYTWWLKKITLCDDNFSCIRSYITSVRDLLPTEPYVFDISRGGTISIGEMFEQNFGLTLLNNSMQRLLDRVRFTTIAGEWSQPDPDRNTLKEPVVHYHGFGSSGDRWRDGRPFDYNQVSEGDGTVLISSSQPAGSNIIQPIKRSNHTGLIASYVQEVMNELGYDGTFSTAQIPSESFFAVFASPLTVRITDPAGRTLDTASGESTIPNAEFIQYDWIKIIGIPNPIPGEYQVELTGTADGEYRGLTAFLNEEAQAAIQYEIPEGFITRGQVITYTAQVPDEVAGPISLVPVDMIPPVTAASLEGTIGTNGWYRSAVTVTLSSSDDNVGVWKTEYRLPEQDWQSYAEPFNINGQGTTLIEFRSTDQVGNVEETQFIEIKIDALPPTIGFDQAPENQYLHSQELDLALVAVDFTSGITSTQLLIDEQLVEPPIDLFNVKLGDHILVGRATDRAGNSSEIRHLFHVGATIGSTISDLNRLWREGSIDKFSTYLKLRIHLELAQASNQAFFLPNRIRERRVKEALERFLDTLARGKRYMTQRAHEILYHDGRYLLEHL